LGIFSFLLKLVTGWGYLLLVFFFGVYFTLKLKGVQFRCFLPALRQSFLGGSKGNKTAFSSFEAASTALAGAMGTGNIAGVAAAIALGGAGAIFWMAASAFLVMAVKYAEIFLAVHFGGKNKIGPAAYMETLSGGRILSLWFCLSAIFASFGIGNLTQVASASAAFCGAFPLSRTACAVLLSVLFFAAVWGGGKTMAKINSVVIPIAAVLYLLLALAVLVVHRTQLPVVLSRIFREAFSFSSAAGGVTGFLTSNAVRCGISRGIFSNESGLGSSAIAHGSTAAVDAEREGLWGIAEVFLDTVLMCTLTGLVILVSGAEKGEGDGSLMTAAAFSSVLGENAVWFIAVISVIFAAASMAGWYYYGTVAIEHLTKSKWAEHFYFLFYVIAVFIGCRCGTEVFFLADILNFFMALPNLISLILLKDKVKTPVCLSKTTFPRKDVRSWRKTYR